MELTLKNKVTFGGQVNSYQVDIEWMHGDANGESHTLSYFFKKDQDEWALEELLLALTELREVAVTEYDDNATFQKWFSSNDYEYESKVEQEKYFPFVWLTPENSLRHYGCYAAIEKYKVYYYDEKLAKYNVNVKL